MPLDSLIKYLRYRKVLSAVSKLEQHTGKHAMNIIDVGGGYGDFAALLRRRGHDVTICDRPVDLENGIPFPDRSFDLAISLAVVEHLQNWPHFLAELRRVSSHVIGTTPAPAGKVVLEWLVRRRWVGPDVQGHIAEHKHYVSGDELRAAGYRVSPFTFRLNQLFCCEGMRERARQRSLTTSRYRAPVSQDNRSDSEVA